MPISVTVATILEDARQRCDLDAFSASTFITDTAALNMAIESCQRLSGIVRTVMGADYFEVSSDITTTANVEYVALPSNCTRLLRAIWVRAANDFIEIERAQRREANAWGDGWSGRQPLYRLRANGINFFPTPDATYTVRLHYDTGIIVSATGDTISSEPGWREWLTLDLCQKFRQREEKDWAEFAAAKGPVEALIVANAPRDKAGIMQVMDVDNMPLRVRPWEL